MDAEPVFLVQTDTTVGLLCKTPHTLNHIKGRKATQPLIRATANLEQIRQKRIPSYAKKAIRRAEKTTFIYPDNEAIRLVQSGEHHDFLKQYGDFYTTSANLTGECFDEVWAREVADIIIQTPQGFYEQGASTLIRLTKSKLHYLRKPML